MGRYLFNGRRKTCGSHEKCSIESVFLPRHHHQRLQQPQASLMSVAAIVLIATARLVQAQQQLLHSTEINETEKFFNGLRQLYQPTFAPLLSYNTTALIDDSISIDDTKNNNDDLQKPPEQTPTTVNTSNNNASTNSVDDGLTSRTIHNKTNNRLKVRNDSLSCASGLQTFELSTGFIYKSKAAEELAMLPGVLQLTDCLDNCIRNASCLAINFENGLCLLLSSSAKLNPLNLHSSQYPVFTIYAEKKCLLAGDSQAPRLRRRCQRAWTFEHVAGFEMKRKPRRRLAAASKEACMEACLVESTFECRSANWYRTTRECTLSDHDRHSTSESEAGDQTIRASLAHFYGPAAASGLHSVAAAPSFSAVANSLLSVVSSNSSLGRGKRRAVPNSRQLHATSAVDQQFVRQSVGVQQYQQHQAPLPANAFVDYLENNCIYEPNKLCEFRKIQNKLIKTVDSIHQNVASLEECKQKCLQAPYRCYSFDYGDTTERVCRTSHLSQAALLSVREPYLEAVGAITYELAACFNVTVVCKAREMVAVVRSSKLFNGKLYVKSRPTSCVTDVTNSLQFELPMRYNDKLCDIRSTSSPSSSSGVFSNEIIIQHHDRILTTQDLSLSVYCQYDLTNKSITNNADLSIEHITTHKDASSAASPHDPLSGTNVKTGGVDSPLTITSLATTVVRAPNVTMRITNVNGLPVDTATVGDRLALMFEVKEKRSPFGIFVREIVAMDGRQLLSATNSSEQQLETLFARNHQTTSSVLLVDSDGCPTDANIMGPLIKMDPFGHTVLAPFDAFKFPASDMVFFRAVVTSCVSECKPASCPGATAGAGINLPLLSGLAQAAAVANHSSPVVEPKPPSWQLFSTMPTTLTAASSSPSSATFAPDNSDNDVPGRRTTRAPLFVNATHQPPTTKTTPTTTTMTVPTGTTTVTRLPPPPKVSLRPPMINPLIFKVDSLSALQRQALIKQLELTIKNQQLANTSGDDTDLFNGQVPPIIKYILKDANTDLTASHYHSNNSNFDSFELQNRDAASNFNLISNSPDAGHDNATTSAIATNADINNKSPPSAASWALQQLLQKLRNNEKLTQATSALAATTTATSTLPTTTTLASTMRSSDKQQPSSDFLAYTLNLVASQSSPSMTTTTTMHPLQNDYPTAAANQATNLNLISAERQNQFALQDKGKLNYRTSSSSLPMLEFLQTNNNNLLLSEVANRVEAPTNNNKTFARRDTSGINNNNINNSNNNANQVHRQTLTQHQPHYQLQRAASGGHLAHLNQQPLDRSSGKAKLGKNKAVSLQEFADSYLGALQSIGGRRKKRQAINENQTLLQPGVISDLAQCATLDPSTSHHQLSARFTRGIVAFDGEQQQYVELSRKVRQAASQIIDYVHHNDQAGNSEEKDEALVVQSIKIIDKKSPRSKRPPPTRLDIQTKLPLNQTRSNSFMNKPKFARNDISSNDASLSIDPSFDKDDVDDEDSGRKGWIRTGTLSLLLFGITLICAQVFLMTVCFFDLNKARSSTMTTHKRQHVKLLNHSDNYNYNTGSFSTSSSPSILTIEDSASTTSSYPMPNCSQIHYGSFYLNPSTANASGARNYHQNWSKHFRDPR